MKKCCYCQATADLRPYGPKGAWLCFDCMKSSPQREAEAISQFAAQLEVIQGPAVIGSEVGPYPAENNPAVMAALRGEGETK